MLVSMSVHCTAGYTELSTSSVMQVSLMQLTDTPAWHWAEMTRFLGM